VKIGASAPYFVLHLDEVWGLHLSLAFGVQANVNSPDPEIWVARKQLEEMAGEGFREVGVLVFVFALLDRIIDGKITPWWTVSAVAVSALFFSAGCYIERRRPDV
jgi:hypothetical protein